MRALGRLHAARPRLSAVPRAHLAAELPDLGSDALIGGIVFWLVVTRFHAPLVSPLGGIPPGIN